MKRLDEIRELLYEQKKISVNDLSTRFNISNVTIRKDLSVLEEEGIAKRVYGGAILASDALPASSGGTDPILSAMVDVACQEIHDGDSIFLGSGKTCCYLAKQLKNFKNLSVVTNNISALFDLLQGNTRVYLLGGEVTSVDNRTLFSSPENPKAFMGNIYVTKAFTSVSGVDLQAGLTVSSVISTYIYHQLPSIARKWYVLTDHTKFNRIAMYPVAELQDISCIVSDSIPSEYLEAFKQQNVQIRTTQR